MGKCVFNPLWLNMDDYKNWLASCSNKYGFSCIICKKEYELGKMGESSLKTHMNGKKHSSLMNAKEATCNGSLKAYFSKVTVIEPSSVQQEPPQIVPSAVPSVPFFKNAVLDAEIRWALKCINSHFPYNSCSDINSVFRDMFPDSEIVKNFSCGPTKCAYITCFGLAPYFNSLLHDSLKEADNFTLLFDESLNKTLHLKQMDIHVRFWHNIENAVKTRYLTSVFLGHSTAEDMVNAFHEATSKLDMSKMLQLLMDGPAVNLKFFSIIRSEIKDEFRQEILNIGTCSLHVLNNAFKTGNRVVNWNVDSLLGALYYLFRDSPSRREDFFKNSRSKKMPVKFCSHRWLENVPATERALEIWEDVEKYVAAIENKEFSKPGSKSYEVIRNAVKDDTITIKLNFFLAVSKILTPFLTRYQTNNPILPFFAEDLRNLMMDLIVNFNIVKNENVVKMDSPYKLSKFDFSDVSLHTPTNKVSLGFVGNRLANSLLFKKKINPKENMALRADARNFVIAVIEKIIEKSHINSLFVRSLSCIDPKAMALHSYDCYEKMGRVLPFLVKCNIIMETECDEVLVDFNKFLNDKASNSDSFVNFDPSKRRLDSFFIDYFDTFSVKLCKIIKSLLILSHGQADVERGFSENKLIEVENMKKESFIAQRTIIDHLKSTCNTDDLITKEMRLSVSSARQRYILHLEEQRKLKETEEQREKRKSLFSHLDDLKNKKRRLEDAIKELEINADNLAEKAEGEGEIKFIYQSNSFRRSSKAKKEELKEIDTEIDSLLKDMKEV